MSATLVSAFVLVSSLVLLLVWVRSAAQSVLGRRFEQDYSREVAEANQLEFLTIRRALSATGKNEYDFSEALSSLERDYEALSYLLRNAATLHMGRYTHSEHLLILDFHLLRAWVRFSRLFGWQSWRSGLLTMTRILEYFGNVVGQRLATFPSHLLSQ
jgi:hypothetical protein